jgi:MFS family permease
MPPDPPSSPASRAPAYRALAVTVITLALAYGVWYAYSVFLVALLKEFGWSRSVLAGAFSVFTLVSGGAGPVLGALADRFGPRRLILAGGALLAASLWADSYVTRAWHLYVGFGLLTAIGVSTAGWTPAVVMVQRQFSARLGLALGIAGSGVGLGIFLVVPLCQALIDAFGWRWAFRALGIFAAVGSCPRPISRSGTRRCRPAWPKRALLGRRPAARTRSTARWPTPRSATSASRCSSAASAARRCTCIRPRSSSITACPP